VRKGLRKTLLRAIKPYAVHQRMVDEDLLAAIHTLDTSMQSLARTQARMDRLLSESRAVPFSSSPVGVLQEHPIAGLVTGFSAADDNGRAEGLYRRFEDIFRGSEAFIRERQRPYLDLIGRLAPVLDLGCGRGEFLDLLREARLDYLGVDADPDMVEHCRRRGHARVERGDAVEFLQAQANGSLGVVFSAQVIEHLPYDALLRIYELSHEKLRDGGLLVLETVNPHSVQALKTFWMDPTHLRPIFPETALALCRLTGFASGFVYHPNGVGNVEVDCYREGEFAVVAVKRGVRPEGSGGDEVPVPHAQVP
jgi:SAM-dependent methyltransferase